MKKMLVFEDDLLSRGLLKRLFKFEFEIDFCDSAEQFYNNFSGNNYDLIIMDISLKGSKSGIELISELKSSNNFKTIPILCLSAHAHAYDKKSALESGADAYLSKPAENNILNSVVRRLLQGRNI